MKEKDNIKIDVSNLNSDLKKYTRECINSIEIFDENNTKIKDIYNKDFFDFNDKNIIDNSEKDKKYL